MCNFVWSRKSILTIASFSANRNLDRNVPMHVTPRPHRFNLTWCRARAWGAPRMFSVLQIGRRSSTLDFTRQHPQPRLNFRAPTFLRFLQHRHRHDPRCYSTPSARRPRGPPPDPLGRRPLAAAGCDGCSVGGSLEPRAAAAHDSHRGRNDVQGLGYDINTGTIMAGEETSNTDDRFTVVAKFAADAILPKVKTMDATGDMDLDIVRGLFDNGVRCSSIQSLR